MSTAVRRVVSRAQLISLMVSVVTRTVAGNNVKMTDIATFGNVMNFLCSPIASFDVVRQWRIAKILKFSSW